MKSDLRYKRQEQLKSFGPANQRKLSEAKVLVVGLGGLGIPVVQYLNAMGVGQLGLVENDTIVLHNLQRQVIYSEKDIGKSKLKVVINHLQGQNSETNIEAFETYLSRKNALDIIKTYDMVVDATDNFPTRYLINDACVILNKPFVYGALHDFEGQVSVFNFKGGPTYRDLFPEMPNANEIQNCDENGVLGVLPGIIGTFQALEVVKLITGIGAPLSGKLLLYDGLTQSLRKIGFKKQIETNEIKTLASSYESAVCAVANEIEAEVFQHLLSGEEVQLIDVRTTEEYEAHHLNKALNIPLAELMDKLNLIDFSRPVYLICQTGARSAKAMRLLHEKHPDTTFKNILGGMNKMKRICR